MTSHESGSCFNSSAALLSPSVINDPVALNNSAILLASFSRRTVYASVSLLCKRLPALPPRMPHPRISRRRRQPRLIRHPRLHRLPHLIIDFQNHSLRPVLPVLLLILALHHRERLLRDDHFDSPRTSHRMGCLAQLARMSWKS